VMEQVGCNATTDLGKHLKVLESGYENA
jgi:hypothetical protein